MAIVFVQQNKKQKVLLLVLILSLVAIAAVIWYGFFRNERPAADIYLEENVNLVEEDIKIDFKVLENPLLKELQPYSEIQPLGSDGSTGSQGRQNPFLPY